MSLFTEVFFCAMLIGLLLLELGRIRDAIKDKDRDGPWTEGGR